MQDDHRALQLTEERTLARVMDYLIWGAFSFLVTYFPLTDAWFKVGSDHFVIVFQLGFSLLYYPVSERLGGTPGKRIMGLATKKTAHPAENISLLQSLVKTAFQFTPVIVFYGFILFVNYSSGFLHGLFDINILVGILLILSPCSMLFSKTQRTLHDKLSASRVGHRRTVQH